MAGKFRGSFVRARGRLAALFALLVPLALLTPASATHLTGAGATYTDGADFAEGSAINVVEAPLGSLSLDDETEPFGFVWVAVSSKGTVVKIDAATGAVKGEYRSSPSGRGADPSRTTVDKDGNVWVTNRAEATSLPADGLRAAGASGSIVHIGLLENGQCVDRNGNGVIDTSQGYGDVRAWANTGGADNAGGVSTADDECILHYVRVNPTLARHVSVTDDNDVWVSGTGERHFDLIDGETGTIIRAEQSVNCGGYGGLIDRNGVIWSARPLLRWDTSLPLVAGNYTCYSHDSYGLAIDGAGNVWNTALSGNIVRKFAADGSFVGQYAHGNYYAQGVVADRNGDIWVAHSLFGPAHVGRLRNDGTYVGNVAIGGYATGVAVDGAGKVWATNHNTGTVSRIDPNGGGAGFTDLETRTLGGSLYNYSDMTGSVLPGAPTYGTWTIVHDGGSAGFAWEWLTWNAEVPEGAELRVEAASSETPDAFGPAVVAAAGEPLGVAPGRYLRIVVTFERAATGESPVLHDLTVGRRATTLEAQPAVATVAVPGSPAADLVFSARLTETSSGAGVPGRTVSFSVPAADGTSFEPACSAVTDASGVASCSAPAALLNATAGDGYEAAFAGDPLYLASRDDGRVVRVTIDLP